MEKSLEYSTSKGTNLVERGPRNMVPAHNYLDGTGKSHVFYGAAYYVPSENRWITQENYKNLPREARRDAILFDSEDEWVAWKIKNDKPHQPSGIVALGYPLCTSDPLVYCWVRTVMHFWIFSSGLLQ